MLILSKNYKKNYAKLKIENLDDLWYLSYVIEKGDLIRARTFRKIKIGKEDDRKSEVVRKPVHLKITVDKVEFSKYTNILRVSGNITEGPEDIPLGSHHTISLEDGTEFTIEKTQFLQYQIDKLEESAQESKEKILLVVHDREEAYFAMLKKYGYELLSQLKGNPQKKTDVKTESTDFFPLIKKTIEDYNKRENFSHIVIASPGFWKEYIQKLISGDLKKKVVYATCSSVGENGINEVMKRTEVQQVLREEKFASEIKKVEEFLKEISQQGKSEYGLEQIKKAVDAGAVSELLVTDGFIQKKRQEEQFEDIERLMKSVESAQGKVHIVSSEHEGGKELDGLGGIGALLRYKISY
ncbi:mRNA surveillance protein pelota [Candidatus Woesearchaeota archaeon]|nr:mRNA surveillance protein pelota [Candidatus Woesearchaeota archaeon]